MAKKVDLQVQVNVNSKIQEVQLTNNCLKIVTPSRLCVAGKTLSGKSQLCLKLIKNRQFIYDVEFKRILYAFPKQSIHLHSEFISQLKDVCPSIEILEGIPNCQEVGLFDDKTSKLLILDDLMGEALTSQPVLDLVCRDSHHSNTSVIITVQNIFHSAPHARTFMRQFSEKILLFSKTESLIWNILSRQIYPNHSSFIANCFQWLLQHDEKDSFKYLLIDASTLSPLPHNAIVRSQIFPTVENDENSIKPIFFFPPE